jgi:hypothetical protein
MYAVCLGSSILCSLIAARYVVNWKIILSVDLVFGCLLGSCDVKDLLKDTLRGRQGIKGWRIILQYINSSAPGAREGLIPSQLYCMGALILSGPL